MKTGVMLDVSVFIWFNNCLAPCAEYIFEYFTESINPRLIIIVRYFYPYKFSMVVFLPWHSRHNATKLSTLLLPPYSKRIL